MIDLPHGWARAKLGELCEINPKHPAHLDRLTQISFVPMPAVSDQLGIITKHEHRRLGQVWKGYTHFQEEDVLFAKITPCMENGKIAIARGLKNGVACGSTEFFVLRCPRGMSNRLLWYFLRQASFRGDAERHMAGAVGQRRVPRFYLENVEYDLAPAAEQERIVSMVESLFARTEIARSELNHIPVLIEHYKRSILAADFTGRLTQPDTKGTFPDVSRIGRDPEALASAMPSHWVAQRLDEIADIQTGLALGKKRSPNEQLYDVPYLRVANVQRGSLRLDEVKTLKATKNEIEKLSLRPGDILMNEGGDRDKLGRGWVWDGQIDPCVHQNHVFRVRLRDADYPPSYISYYANEFGQSYFFTEGTQTTNLASISKAKVSALPVPLAPRDEAIEIVREIEAAFARLSVLEKEYERALALLDHLDAAVLAKAFRGELVPQDASYEPASVLLERIRAERESLVSAPRQRRVKEQVKTSGSSSKRGKVMPKKRSNVGVSHLSELLMRMGGSAGSQELWRQSDMDLDEFYKLLRDEVKAGRIVECADKERLEVRDAA